MIRVVSVSEFISQINDIIAGEFVVEGEVSSYKVSQGKWVFFDLKDDRSVLSCFAIVYQVGQPLEDGMKVLVLGYPKIHDKSGRFSLTVQKVEMVGEGSLKKAYLLLKKKLTDEGLFALERKRKLPELPARIGVIASRDSAAFGDFKRILNNRWGGVEINLYNTAVQGEQAVGEIVGAYEYFNAHSDEAEVIVMIRGGGSLEDLSAFNDERVVRAVYGSKIPVICGVGHERDESLADFAADVRASTPSNAAEIVVPDKKDFVAQLEFSLDNIAGDLEHEVTKQRRGLEQLSYAIFSRLEKPLRDCRSLIDSFGGLLERLGARVERQREFVLGAERLFNNVNPKRVLSRGFSIARDRMGRIIRAASQVDAGDLIVVELSEGSIGAEVFGDKPQPAQIKLFV
ncbi:MAG: exodeoxyribonuclease VII large subunit [Candidatus Magasanikbacteria bacterium]|jgi:exodeoxyribonuclease VII large subunit